MSENHLWEGIPLGVELGELSEVFGHKIEGAEQLWWINSENPAGIKFFYKETPNSGLFENWVLVVREDQGKPLTVLDRMAK